MSKETAPPQTYASALLQTGGSRRNAESEGSMNDEEFKAMRLNVILFAIGAVILALDLFIWRP
jgi:hypothetical protein